MRTNDHGRICGVYLFAWALSLAACEPDAADSNDPGGNTGHGGQGGIGADSGTLIGVELPVKLSTLVVATPDGVKIAVNDADGKLVRVGEPNAEGRWITAVPPNGSATAIIARSYLSQGKVKAAQMIHTVFDIPLGATVALKTWGTSVPTPHQLPMGSLTVDVGGVPPTVSKLELVLSCRSPQEFEPLTTKITVEGYEGCVGKDTYDAFVIGRAVDGSLKAVGSLPKQPFSAGKSAQSTVTLDTPLDGVYAITQGVVPGYPIAELSLHGSPAPFIPLSDRRVQTDPPMPFGAMLQLPVSAAAGAELRQSLSFDQGNVRGALIFSRRFDKLAGPVSWSPTSLARLSDLPMVDLSDAAHPGVVWSLSQDGDLGDRIEGVLAWGGEAHGDAYIEWRFTAPVSRQGAAHLPELPAEMADLLPQLGDSVGLHNVRHIDWSTKVDYAASLDYAGDSALLEPGDQREAFITSYVTP